MLVPTTCLNAFFLADVNRVNNTFSFLKYNCRPNLYAFFNSRSAVNRSNCRTLVILLRFLIMLVALYMFACAVLELISRDHALRAEDEAYYDGNDPWFITLKDEFMNFDELLIC